MRFHATGLRYRDAIAPQHWTAATFDDPPSEPAKSFKQLVLREGVRLFPRDEP